MDRLSGFLGRYFWILDVVFRGLVVIQRRKHLPVVA